MPPARMSENVNDGPVDHCIPSAASLVRWNSSISDACHDESGLDPPKGFTVEREPRNGSNRAWDEEEAVRVPEGHRSQMIRELCRQRDPR